MKKLYMLLLAVLALSTAYGKTLRVNNVPGNGAPYTSVDEALSAASAGDVIIIEKSKNSYGNVTITKPVTLQGEGYFLDINSPDNEGASSSAFDAITIKSPNVKLSSLHINNVTIRQSKVIVCRCSIGYIAFSDPENDPNGCSDCIIHQNFITSLIQNSYSNANNIQITNNIFTNTNGYVIYRISNSIIKRNTFQSRNDYAVSVNNCKIENNINGTGKTDSSNTLANNVDYAFISENFKNDKTVKEAEEYLDVDAGAFSGNDPYVLSGIARGVRVIDFQMPESVEQGSDLQVTVKVASQR